jgi:hypothetical protein
MATKLNKMKNKLLILLVMAMFSLNSALYAQQKYALLIGGDYHPGSEIPVGHQWNNGNDLDPVKGWDEFWNDTYLMWELLYDDPISSYSDENITVLFAQGIDYTFPNQYGRYKSSYMFDIPSITDGEATKINVMDALDDMILNINPEDYLFIWIMSNGGNTDPADNVYSYVYLWGYDPANPNAGRLYDYELKAKLDLIPAHKKVVVVQAPNSGKFATTLADDNTIVITSSQIDEPSIRANDTPYEENEWWGGVQYHHGEFGYHLYSPLNGEDPGYGESYGPSPFENTNTDDDDVIDFEEAIDWELANNNSTATAVVSDMGSISDLTTAQYSGIVSGDIYTDKEYIGTLCLTGPPLPGPHTDIVIYQGDVTFKTAKVYFLDDARLINTNYGNNTLTIEKKVSLFGTNSSSMLLSLSDLVIGLDVTFSGLNGQRWGGLAVQNHNLYFERTSFIDCIANLHTIPNLIIKDCDFIRAGLLGQFLFNNTQISNGTNFINSYADLYGYGSGTILIDDCNFTGPVYNNSANGIQLKSYKNFAVINSIIQNFGYGLYLLNCSGPRDQRDISNNSIHGNYKVGVYINRSYANIFDNPGIYENKIGIQSINYSNVRIEGEPDANHVSETQRIHDNDQNQIRASKESFPYLKWNAIWYNFNTDPLIYWDLGSSDPGTADISNNFWGAPEYFDPNEDLFPTNAFNWNPIWNLQYGLPPTSDDEVLYESAGAKALTGDFAGAKSDYIQLVSEYPESRLAEAALKEMLPLEEDFSNDYTILQQYYLNDPDITGNVRLAAIGQNLANWCNVIMEDYSTAIQYYNDILANPPSYHDSIFAIFDLDYINFLVNNAGYKSSFSDNSLIFDILAKEQKDAFTDFHSGLLFPKQEICKQMKENIESLQSGELIQNFPNPFNRITEIWYTTEKPASAIINVYDYTGKMVCSLDQGIVTGGNHKVLFVNENLSPGLYFYNLILDGIKTDTKKMTLMR